MNPTDIRRGLDALNPAQHTEQASQTIQSEQDQRSQEIQEDVAKISSAPDPTLDIFDSSGDFLQEGTVVDGDGPTNRHRLSYDPNVPEDQGKAFDAWETDHGPEWIASEAGQNKLLKQRKALARLLGEDLEDVTNEDVFAMGEASKARLNEFFQTDDGINQVNIEGKGGTGRFGRATGQAFLNSNGEDARAFMNNPLDNADYHSRFNVRGREEHAQGSKRLHGEEELSDFEATQTTSGRIDNVGLTLRDGANNTSSFIGDFLSLIHI